MDFQSFTFAFDGLPMIMSLAVEPDETLIHVPAPLVAQTNRSPLPLSKLGGEPLK